MRPYGERGLLIDTTQPLALVAAAAAQDGVVDVVPGVGSLLVLFADLHARQAFRLPTATDVATPAQAEVIVPVVYDGADLPAVARRAELSVPEVIALHSGASYVVGLLGFVPGFAYLRGTPEVLHLPRRSEPRTVVPAGSVAIAAGWSGIYPRATPGGWHLLGRTDAVLWDVRQDPPALLRPGTRVRFESL